jgi:hypothetical protein
MAKGIVIVTPTTTHDGQLRVTEPNPEPYPSPYKVAVDDLLEFKDPGIAIKFGDTVEFALTSLKTCNVTKLLEPAK